MSERGFSRHYAAATGQTPLVPVVEGGSDAASAFGFTLPVKRIASRCGFGSEETMRRSFHRLMVITPQDYRAPFGA